jgi:hypothetical protein
MGKVKRRILGVVLALLGLWALLVGCGREINRAAEQKIADSLPDLIGPARKYQVHITNPADRTLRGKVSRVVIDGTDVELSNGLLLDAFHAELKDVDFDTKRKKVNSIKEIRFQATLGEASIDEFLAGETPPGETIRKVRVTFGEGNRVSIAAERVTVGVGVPFTATGPLRILSPTRLELDPTRLVVVGVPIEGVPLRFLKERFEGSLDLGSLPVAPSLTEVRTTPGKLILSGTLNPAPFLQHTPDTRR